MTSIASGALDESIAGVVVNDIESSDTTFITYPSPGGSSNTSRSAPYTVSKTIASPGLKSCGAAVYALASAHERESAPVAHHSFERRAAARYAKEDARVFGE